jgi:hypothetical protein
MVNAVFTLSEYRDEVAMDRQYAVSIDSSAPYLIQTLSVLRGKQLKFAEANEFWKQLKTEDQLSLARQVLRQLREKPLCQNDGVPNVAATGVLPCAVRAKSSRN